VLIGISLAACGSSEQMPDGSYVAADADVAPDDTEAPDVLGYEEECAPDACPPEGSCRTSEDCDQAKSFYCVPPGSPNACGICFDGADECMDDDDCATTDLVCVRLDEPCLCRPYWACVPGCTSDEGCGDGQACDGHHCVAAPCAEDADCPALFQCSEGKVCARRPCTTDEGCPGGFCVESSCHDTLGNCEQPAA
jgi:hypothetical protein